MRWVLPTGRICPNWCETSIVDSELMAAGVPKEEPQFLGGFGPKAPERCGVREPQCSSCPSGVPITH
jgi:hypothetical protein